MFKNSLGIVWKFIRNCLGMLWDFFGKISSQWRRRKFKSLEAREAGSSHFKEYALMINKTFQFSCLFVFKLFIVWFQYNWSAKNWGHIPSPTLPPSVLTALLMRTFYHLLTITYSANTVELPNIIRSWATKLFVCSKQFLVRQRPNNSISIISDERSLERV